MIESLVLAEFHEIEGSKCVLKYPRVLYDDSSGLENYIVPEGLHNFSQDSSIVLIRRNKKSVSCLEHPRFQAISKMTFQVDLYEFLDDWVQISKESCLTVLFSAEKGFLVVKSTDGEIAKIEIHDDIQFTVLEETFASLYTVDGKAYGLHFGEGCLRDFDSFINFLIEGVLSETEKQIISSELLFCLSVGSIKKSDSTNRGVKIMGLAALSPSKLVINLDSVLSIALDQIMEKPDKAARILKRLFRKLNSVGWPTEEKSEEQKRVLKFCTDRGFQAEVYRPLSFEYQGLKICTEVNQLLLEEEIIDVSLKKLFDIFQDNLIKIYNCLIQEKRIIVFARNKPCHYICNMTLAVARMASPPVPYLVKQHVFPYVALSDLDFLNMPFFIAGANNPLFRHREQWWDLLADLDTGEVITSVPVPKLLLDFMSSLKETLQFDPSAETFLKSQFFDYTSHILDFQMFPSVFDSFEELPKIEIKSEQSFQYFLIKKKFFSSVLEEISLLLLRLRLMHITEKFENIEKTYKCLYKSLKFPKNLLFFLSVLPNCGDLHCIASGFFIENTKVWRYACKILSLIEETQEGQYLVELLQANELNSYLAYKNRI